MKTKILIFLLLSVFTFACKQQNKEDNERLGQVKDTTYTIGSFRKYLVNQYALDETKLAASVIRSIYREYYNQYIYYKEGLSTGYFEQPEVKKQLEQKKLEMIKAYLSQTIFELEIKPKLDIPDKELEAFRTKTSVSHILIMTGKRPKEDALKLVLKVKSEITDKSKFAEIAARYSEDPGSASKGGDLGWVDYSTSFVENFKRALLTAKTGEIVGPVETEYGYHLIYPKEEKKMSLEEVRKDQKVIDNLKRSKSLLIVKKYMEELREKYKNQVHLNLELLKNPEKNSAENLYSVDGAGSMTISAYMLRTGGDLKKFKEDPEEFRKSLFESLIDGDLRYLDGKSKGYTALPQVEKRVEFEMVLISGTMYSDYLRAQFDRQIKVSEEDAEKFYRENPDLYKDNNQLIAYKIVRTRVKEDLLSRKRDSYMINLKIELDRKYGIIY